MQRVRDYLLNVIVALLVVTALFLGGLRVWQSLAGTETTTTIREWQQYAQSGQRRGPKSARVVIVWFGDYQCPYCRMAAVDIENLLAKYRDDLAIVFRHYPLSLSAKDAATAAECAAAQGRFEPFHRMLFAYAESLGTRSMSTLASDAGIASLGDFEDCLANGDGESAVRRDLTAGIALGVVGTPTFLINDLLVPTYPGAVGLERYVAEALRR